MCRIDATIDDGSLGRQVSDDNIQPNSVMKLIEVDKSPHLCLFALKDMMTGTELRYNYGDAEYYWRKQVGPICCI